MSSPPTLAKTSSGSAGQGRIDVQCLSNDRRLMRHPFRSARPSGGYLFGRLLQQNGGDGAGGGGVADPHFAGNEQLCAACGRFFRQGYADFHSPAAVRRRHSGARRHIIGAAPDSSPLHTFMCVRCSDPHIHHTNRRAQPTGESVDGAAAPGKIDRLGGR